VIDIRRAASDADLEAWQDGNDAMRGLSASLGYTTRSVCTRVLAGLPLP
jgi:hypothetical protein